MATTLPKTSAAAGAASAAKAKTVKGLRIVARSEGFRRAGRAFGAEPVEIPLSDLEEAQIKALRVERELVVVDVDISTDEADADEVPAAE